jgi:hypothetical protein
MISLDPPALPLPLQEQLLFKTGANPRPQFVARLTTVPLSEMATQIGIDGLFFGVSGFFVVRGPLSVVGRPCSGAGPALDMFGQPSDP